MEGKEKNKYIKKPHRMNVKKKEGKDQVTNDPLVHRLSVLLHVKLKTFLVDVPINWYVWLLVGLLAKLFLKPEKVF